MPRIEEASMDEQAEKKASAGLAEEAQAAVEVGLGPQVWMMVQAFWGSPQRTKILLLGVALVIIIGATAFAQIRLNAWNQPFYDAIQRKDLDEFLRQLIVFAVIAGVLLCLNVAQTWAREKTKLKLREGLVRDLFDEWLEPKRAFRLASAGDIGSNPDQRIHEDARHLTELTTELGVGLLQSTLLLLSFVGVLWMLSANVTFHWHGEAFGIPGYMVWAALFYAGTASWLSWRVGRPLIQLQADRYAREAELRYALVRLNEHVDSVALQGGEADEKGRLNYELNRVLAVMQRIVGGLTQLTWVTAGYGWFTIIAPILVAAPGYFGGDLSFGAMMVTVGAFFQVQQSLRWFIDNFSTIADWRATLLRVANFREAVTTLDGIGKTASRIEFGEAEDDHFVIERLEIASPTGCTMLSERHVTIKPGERVLIVGEPGAGKTILFRALAGLWPWGAGRIALPKGDRVTYVPRQPYVPPGTLRAALSYPAPESAYADADIVAALEGCGLGHLAGSLDRSARWDRELTDDELQCLVLARLVLIKPRWLVIDEVLDALDDDVRERMMVMLRDKLPETAIINIGRQQRDHFFARVLHLVKDSAGRRFQRRIAAMPRPRVVAAAQ
jgi:vitamin B12/bleomycin/antimicrobial peptide transport system ATP-binding/permease protein